VVRRDKLEKEVISGLQREVLREDIAAFALEEFKRQLRARRDDTRPHLALMRNKREKLKTEISNLATAIAEGHRSAALLDQLGKCERELDDISEELLAADGRGLMRGSKRLRRLFRSVCRLLSADVPRAKAELSKHCKAITLTSEGSTFRITGDWNLLGGRSDGAGGLDSTVGPSQRFRFKVLINKGLGHSIIPCRPEQDCASVVDLAACRRN
jgi:hypothetical protein